MFDAILRRDDPPRRRLGTGLLFSSACHAAVIGVVLYASTHVTRPPLRASEVTFFAPPPPPLSGGGGASRSAEASRPAASRPAKDAPRADAKPVHAKLRRLEQRGDVDNDVNHAAAGGAPAEGAQPSGAEGGVPGGVAGGMVGGALDRVVPFGEGMTTPTLIAGPAPAYTPEALAARVQGTMLVKCVITTTGSLTNCRVIKSLPYMERPVLEALANRRYTPVLFQGSPINVDYVIPIRLTLESPGPAQRR